MHIDTGYEYPEMIDFRDWFVAAIGARLIVHTNRTAAAGSTHTTSARRAAAACCAPRRWSRGFATNKADAALGGARRDEERSRAKERIFSFRDPNGGWDPKAQRPELWSLYNGRVSPGEHIRVFPLSNWTELDVWSYIEAEDIPLPPLYFAPNGKVVERAGSLHSDASRRAPAAGGKAGDAGAAGCARSVVHRARGAIESDADTVAEIVAELRQFRRSERENRVIDHDQDGSMDSIIWLRSPSTLLMP